MPLANLVIFPFQRHLLGVGERKGGAEGALLGPEPLPL